MAARAQPLTDDARRTDPYRSRLDPEPALVDRVDPVVYGKGAPPPGLDRAMVERYERDGFIELEGLLQPAELAALQRELVRLREDTRGIDPDTLICEPGGTQLRSIFAIHEQSALIRRLATDERLVRIAQYLLGDEVYIHQSRLNYKPGFFGKEFYWHSDFETWHTEDGMPRMRALSMSIALTENTGFNGPLMVIPGSHRRYVSCVGETPEDHYKQSLRRQEYGVPDPGSLERLFNEGGGITTFTGAPGKIVLFDCNAMHGSNSNISPLPRSNVFLVFNSVTNRLVAPYAAAKPRPEFIAARRNVTALVPRSGPLCD